MEFILTTGDPCNANYCLTSGDVTQVIYRTHSPFRFKNPVATIEKIVLPQNHEDVVDMQDEFSLSARIEFNVWRPHKSRVALGYGVPRSTDEIFRPGGWGWYGVDYLCTGPSDGREYKWRVYRKKVTLFLNSTPKILVAKFHRRHRRPPRQASFEILEEGVHMVDFIVMGFVYMELLRKERDRKSVV